MFTIDAHLDLSMNAMEWNRDLRVPASELDARERARGLTDKPDRDHAVVSFQDLRRGHIGFVVATQIADRSNLDVLGARWLATLISGGDTA
jgi:membrane dipeptidase